jgi:predicted AAA+ superfamily ATPase
MELFAKFDDNLISWKSRNSEIEFLIEKEDKLIPIEVKSSTRYRQAKSLKVYIEKNNPELAYKVTMENFYKKDNFINLPMYLI